MHLINSREITSVISYYSYLIRYLRNLGVIKILNWIALNVALTASCVITSPRGSCIYPCCVIHERGLNKDERSVPSNYFQTLNRGINFEISTEHRKARLDSRLYSNYLVIPPRWFTRVHYRAIIPLKRDNVQNILFRIIWHYNEPASTHIFSFSE